MFRRQKVPQTKRVFSFQTSSKYGIYCAAIAAPFALVPQVLRLYTTHDASSLSLSTWAILGSVNCMWLVYGIYHRETPITITNTLLAIFNFTMVKGIMLYQ